MSKGYTLVEMVVVMAIMAILMLLSASGFILIRDQYAADQSAEELLTNIREAQNKAISISRDKLGNNTKVWSVEVTNNSFAILSLYDHDQNNTGLISAVEKNSPQVTTINSTLVSGSVRTVYNTPFYISYSAPFGKSYTTKINCGQEKVACSWTGSTRPTEEWIVNGSQTLAATEYVEFDISKNGKVSTVVIRGNGDAYIK